MAAGDTDCANVVWLDLTSNQYTWWPSKVQKNNEETVYLTFGDGFEYKASDFKPKKVRGYNCEELEVMVAQGKKKFRKRLKIREVYCKALDEACEYIKEHIDPNFSLEMASNSSSLLENNSTLFTMSTDSIADEPCSRSNDVSASEDSLTIPRRKKNERKRKNGTSKALPSSSQCIEEGPEVVMASAPKRCKYGDFPVDPLTQSIPTSHYSSHTPPHIVTSKTLPSSQCVEEGSEAVIASAPKNGNFPADPLTQSIPSSHYSSHTPPRIIETVSSGIDRSQLKDESIESPDVSANNLLQTSSQATPLTTIASSSLALCTSTPRAPVGDLSVSSSNGESDRQLDSINSSDEDLPLVNLSVNEAPKIHELKSSEVVWAKYKKFPHWPALVISVKVPKQKFKSTASIYFFGYSETIPVTIRNHKKLAPFGSKSSEDYIREGKECPLKQSFIQAVKEAREFIRDKAEGIFANCNAKEAFKKISERRPRDYNSPVLTAEEESVSETLPHSPESSSLSLEKSAVSSANESDSDGGEESSEDEDCPPYTYDRVVEEIRAIKPVLEGIVRGEVESAHHSTFLHGNQKERGQLKVGNQRGPIQKWPQKKVSSLLEGELLGIAKLGDYKMNYALDVLLPEAMLRVKSQVENISLEQALKEFSNKV